MTTDSGTTDNATTDNATTDNGTTDNGTTDNAIANNATAHGATAGTDTTPVLTADTVGAVIDRATFDDKGLLPAIVQQEDTGEVLMLGYMNAEALRRTLTEGRVTFWSRSRQEYWRKGDTSGHRQYVRTAALDCDGDTLLLKVIQIGPACHTGAHACFDVDPLSPHVGQPADWTEHE